MVDTEELDRQEVHDPREEIKIDLNSAQSTPAPVKRPEIKNEVRKTTKSPKRSDPAPASTMKVKMVKSSKALNSIIEENADSKLVQLIFR